MPLRYLALTTKKKTSVLLFLLICNIFGYAQQGEGDPVPLISILKSTETAFNVRFSYNRRDLKDLFCDAPAKASNLEQSLSQLSANCGVQFYRIDTRYIAVQLNTEPLISVCGTLIDRVSGSPIKGATVRAGNAELFTNGGGEFSLEGVPVNGTITIYHLGFKVKELKASELQQETTCPLLFTDEKFNYLPTVLINNYLTSGVNKNAEGSVAISNSGFEILPSLIEPDVLRIAQILPGIESFDETSSGINIRGGKSDEVLLLWDDIRMYQSGHFFGLISAFNPNLTKNVTIYKNGTHPRYGEGVSGVLSMKSDGEMPEQVTGAASIDFISTQLYAKIPASERLAFHLSGRTSINTGIGNPVYKQFFDRTFQNTVVTNVETETSQGLRSTDEAFNFFDLSFKGIWEVSNKDKVQYNFMTIFNKLSFIERFTSETALTKNESELKQRNLVNGLRWERDWSNRIGSRFTVNSSNYVNNGGNQNVDTGDLQSLRNEVKERQLQAELFWTITSEISLNSGYQYTETEIVNTESPFGSNTVQTDRAILFANAGFMNTKINIFNRNTILSAGVRFTAYPNLEEDFIEPRLNLFQRISPVFSLTVSAEKKHQAIVQSVRVQNTVLGVETLAWQVRNSEEFPILRSEQVSIGGLLKKNGWNVSLEGFLKNIDGINTANQGFRNQLAEVNLTGENRVSGIEISIGKRTDQLNAWFSYTFLDNTYEFDSLTPPEFRSNFDIKHTASLAASYSWNSFLFSLGTNYHSGIPFTAPDENEPLFYDNGVVKINFGTVNSSTLPEFFRTDFSASYTRQLDPTFTGKIAFGLLNIFNRKNALGTYYAVDMDAEGNPVINRIEQYSLGFTPNISLQLRF